MLTLAKCSVGVGDRFARQAKARLRACLLAARRGVEVVPVWNKSNRVHTIIGSGPGSVQKAAGAAVKRLGWSPETVGGWTAEQFTGALRHDRTNPAFNPPFRQPLHVGFAVAAQMGARYLNLLESCEDAVSRNVTTNLYDRHIKPLFV